MTKIAFRATAINELGDTWRFVFFYENWNGVQQAADAALAELVAKDQFHQKYGPWRASVIDRTGA